MMRRLTVLRSVFVVCVVGLASTTLVAGRAARQAPADRNTPSAAADTRAMLDQYCVTCHNQRAKAGELTLDDADTAAVPQHAELWERVIRKLRAGVMPPAGARRPAPAVRDAFLKTLESEIDRAAAANPNPGRTETLHRLNRAEYHNAVRDVLGLDIDVTQLLAPDDASYGFDNIAGVLKLNQSNMERYLTAAMRVSRAAIGVAPSAPTVTVFPVPFDQPQYDRLDGLPFGTRGGTLIKYNFPVDGEYEVKVTLACTTEADLECNGSIGWAEAHELQVLLDGNLVRSWKLEPKPVNLQYPNNDTSIGPVDKDQRWTVRIPALAGQHDVGVTFVAGPDVEYVRPGYRKRLQRPFRYYADAMFIAVPFVDRVEITGPLQVASPGDTLSRRTIFTCRPASVAEETPCARKILSALARRAYRRPVASDDVSELMAFFEDGRRQGGFEQGIEMAIRRMLVTTKFLFRMEKDPANAKPGTPYRISNLELASRLSFFLWSSVPDEALLTAAVNGSLARPQVLDRQVKRMLADPKAAALVDNFFGQWLRLRHVGSHRPSEPLFPDFEHSLKEAVRLETELFVDYIVRKDRSALDLIEADYTFVNERLAKHYDIPNVQGPEFRKVTYPDDHRRGLLGHASMLMLTSHANRTSPVMRGKWVLENILATPPPPPPANVPQLPEDQLGSRKSQTMRDKMAAHRANPVCSACHSMIDPLGFGLENFDPVGRWRDVDANFTPLDTTGVLPDGTSFKTLTDFRGALLAKRELFLRSLTDKLLTYALGRGTEPYDMPAIRKAVANAATTNYRFSALVMEIVTSVPFQMRRADAPVMARR